MKINFSVIIVAVLQVAFASARAADADRQSRADAWWTGPLLAASAGTLAQGHFLIEPYLFDSIPRGRYDIDGNRGGAPRENNFGSQSYVLYGLTDRTSVGLIPRFGFNEPAGGSSSSGVGVGDLSLQAQYGLTQFAEGGWLPSTSVVIQETLPTGKYDRLGHRPADGLGTGAYATTLALYSQYFSWLPNGRILRTRLDLSYSLAGAANIRDVSVYGTAQGFRGRGEPGDSLSINAAGEYSVTRNWVLALDVIYQHDAATRVSGFGAGGVLGEAIRFDSGSGYTVSFAPAIEYNWTSRVGVIVGAKLTALGRNSSAAILPVAAINIVI